MPGHAKISGNSSAEGANGVVSVDRGGACFVISTVYVGKIVYPSASAAHGLLAFGGTTGCEVKRREKDQKGNQKGSAASKKPNG